ncbi:MAG TPA: asparagine synthase (glutamine-hydrolyzing) [Terriglobales bacterium]|nr:asparagine synthase (glutamine-hydrolyzing) [Dongiaceae bacterium]HVO62200.1 asparagine synthase (glutamine-hydrolyzing) [Terriglobales bacterium]
MCGIAGYCANNAGDGVDKSILLDMASILGHRGPDGRSVFVDGPVGLSHARLSIIDIQGGNQPMCNENGSIWITFNGEIFNFVELREQLLRQGHCFSTHSDTEVILHLYEEEGLDCLRRLNGQWAFALWDRNRQLLFLARDRLGICPLYYTQTDGKLLFASEIKALFCHPAVSRRIDLQGLDQIFTYWCNLDGHTAFEGVREVPPGCLITFQSGNLNLRRYWSLSFSEKVSCDNGQSAEELLHLLTDSVKIRLRSDVPVGLYLSGGLDSTVAGALMRKCTDASLRTFSISFADSTYDEALYQDEASRFFGTTHSCLKCVATDIGRVFPDVIWHAEKPLLRTAPAPLFLLSRLVRDCGYKVVVTGEGSDEVLGGYDIFKEAKIRRFCAQRPESTRRPKLLTKLYPYMPDLRSQSEAYLQKFFCTDPADLHDPFFSHLPRWKTTAGIKLFLSGEIANSIGMASSASLRNLPDDYSTWNWLAKAQYLETITLLPGYILSSQGDRVAMAHGVESRPPFLDHRVVEFAAKLPPELKIRVLNEKYLLKQCTRDIIPPSIRERPKQPYRAPESASFFAEPLDYVDELLRPDRLREDGIFDPQRVGMLVAKARKGLGLSTRENMAVVAIISTQLLIDRFIRQFPAGAA